MRKDNSKKNTYAVVALSVGIRADHIHSGIARVPVSSNGVPNPQDVVDLVVVGWW